MYVSGALSVLHRYCYCYMAFTVEKYLGYF